MGMPRKASTAARVTVLGQLVLLCTARHFCHLAPVQDMKGVGWSKVQFSTTLGGWQWFKEAHRCILKIRSAFFTLSCQHKVLLRIPLYVPQGSPKVATPMCTNAKLSPTAARARLSPVNTSSYGRGLVLEWVTP
eukprot:CAMPEP_0181228752 /NCGR_PEP_ID=MMETSP1096-20121128/33519_1 /TAXON_ID=156174 ORGANISM="Chrysochromulina ericina, Strain CCMP281" /NCGR_SAMPLE_ID=MMETSP1096 /ASSEMBLY_ACC=CAM_ASM_000453 /LENGTH=133 /DNA_ID=CAMNT_0023322305 /DNA_START=171 /DNA_END=572 /DNA_ORIENTATION=+